MKRLCYSTILYCIMLTIQFWCQWYNLTIVLLQTIVSFHIKVLYCDWMRLSSLIYTFYNNNSFLSLYSANNTKHTVTGIEMRLFQSTSLLMARQYTAYSSYTQMLKTIVTNSACQSSRENFPYVDVFYVQ